MVHRRWRAGKEGVHKSHRLVNGDWGQTKAARHIADSKDRGHSRLAVGIHRDRAIGRKSNAERLDPKSLRVRLAPCGKQDLIKEPRLPPRGGDKNMLSLALQA